MNLRPKQPISAQRGARLGVAGLSGPAAASELSTGLEALESLGFEVVRASNLGSENGLFAGSDGDRVQAFHDLLADDQIDGILFARGGHGLLRLLDLVDWDLVARRPRWFVGYSDLTPLLAAVVSRCGWQALHGPMVAVELAQGLGRIEAESLVDALAGSSPRSFGLAGVEGSWTGIEGPLVGGCLSLLVSTLGTPWAVSAAGCVLFLEDVAEPLYRVDRMLQQLRLSGALHDVRGVVLGAFAPPEAGVYASEHLLQAVRDAAGPDVPVAWGCSSGHCRPNLTLTLGATATVEQQVLTLSTAG